MVKTPYLRTTSLSGVVNEFCVSVGLLRIIIIVILCGHNRCPSSFWRSHVMQFVLCSLADNALLI